MWMSTFMAMHPECTARGVPALGPIRPIRKEQPWESETHPVLWGASGDSIALVKLVLNLRMRTPSVAKRQCVARY